MFPKPQIERTLEIVTIPELCKGTSCKICIAFCKNNVFELTTKEFNSRGNYFVKVVADEKCDECLNCYRYCPEFAIFLKFRKPIHQEELVQNSNEKE